MSTYENYCKMRDMRAVNDSTVARETGIGRSTFSEWKKGTYTPKLEKLQKIANYFNVPVSAFTEDDKPASIALRSDETALLSSYNSLNNTGKEKVVNYADDLHPKYGRKDSL